MDLSFDLSCYGDANCFDNQDGCLWGYNRSKQEGNLSPGNHYSDSCVSGGGVRGVFRGCAMQSCVPNKRVLPTARCSGLHR